MNACPPTPTDAAINDMLLLPPVGKRRSSMKKSRLGESQRPIYEASNARWYKLQELAAWLKILAGHGLVSPFRGGQGGDGCTGTVFETKSLRQQACKKSESPR
jgi:hypothetical protein